MRLVTLSSLLVVGSLLYTGPGLADEPHAVVLLYHRFGEDRYPSTSITLAQFDAQLDYLEQNEFEVLPLATVLAAMDAGGDLPDLCLVITVDDAFRSVYDEAFPRLRARGWPFTIFVSTDAVDDGLPGYMTWPQLREMRDAGVSFANHTATHDSLVARADDEDVETRTARIRRDIERAGRRLRDELGQAPSIFAYPYGEFDTETARLVADLGLVAFGQQSGALGPLSDRRALPRFPMAEAYAALPQFRDKVRSLPLLVRTVSPWDPRTDRRRPTLVVELAETIPNAGELACFAGGQGRIPLRWLEPGRRFEIQADRELAPGRNRYNCTVPSADRSRYHWFSHPFIVESAER